MNAGENTDSVRDVEENMKNDLQKKREISNVLFETSEEKRNLRKTEHYGENELKDENKSNE